jgi:hypothetical protein
MQPGKILSPRGGISGPVRVIFPQLGWHGMVAAVVQIQPMLKKEDRAMINLKRLSVNLVLFTTIILALLSCFPTSASAHPPKDIQLSYDAASKTLTTTITHNSVAPAMHYIKQVEIKKNGTLVSSNLYKSQPDKNSFTYTYSVPAAPGDVIEVTGTCNIYGSKMVKLDISKPAAKPGE